MAARSTDDSLTDARRMARARYVGGRPSRRKLTSPVIAKVSIPPADLDAIQLEVVGAMRVL